jgi:hypothetical protein
MGGIVIAFIDNVPAGFRKETPEAVDIRIADIGRQGAAGQMARQGRQFQRLANAV